MKAARMYGPVLLIIGSAAIFTAGLGAQALDANRPPTPSHPGDSFTELVNDGHGQASSAKAVPARSAGQEGVAILFKGTGDLHYYADPQSAPGPGLELQVKPEGPDIRFGAPVFPGWSSFEDSALQRKIDVFVGDFAVFIPVLNAADIKGPVDVEVRISGLTCTSKACLPPFEKTLSVRFDPAGSVWVTVAPSSRTGPQAPTASTTPVLPESPASYGIAIYFLLAVLAGILINIMPCVLPVIPLVVLRLARQSKTHGRNRMVGGAAFCAGIVLFFAIFAAVAAILNVTTGSILELNSLFRYPKAAITLFLMIVFFGLMMLDVIALTLPSVAAGNTSSGSGAVGSLGMGFLAGLLSTPCSGALLGFVLVWAQTQPLAISSIAILLMGVGMALPYGIVIVIPSLLDRIPKPGRWMDLFKKSCGFLLLFIAVKLTLEALPKEQLISVLLYGVIFGFCVWMWGQWVDSSTPAPRRWAVRLMALAIAVIAGLWLLPQAKAPIAWQGYDAKVIERAEHAGQPVLLKFTADWCTNCKVLDRRVFHDAQVARLINAKGVLTVRADTTSWDMPATKDLKEVYGEPGTVPVTILLLPESEPIKLRGILDKSRLLDLLKTLPDRGKP